MNAPNPSGWRPSMTSGDGEQAPATSSGDRGLALEEPLIFELASPGTCGVDFDEADPEPLPALSRHLRKDAPALPGLTEPEAVRHYTRLSRQNYAIDLGPTDISAARGNEQIRGGRHVIHRWRRARMSQIPAAMRPRAVVR